MNAGSNAAAVFRSLAHARHTCRRFQPQQTIPQATLRDILDTTLVGKTSWSLYTTSGSSIWSHTLPWPCNEET